MALVPKSDTYAASVSLLLPFDADLTDYSATPKAVTAYGNAAVSADYKKFWEKSCYFDGTGDYLSAGVAADWTALHISGAKWTVEGWIRITDYSSARMLFSTSNASSANVGVHANITTSRTVIFGVSRGEGGVSVCAGTFSGVIPNDSTFHHIAITYDHTLSVNNATLWIDGVASGSLSKTANSPSPAAPISALQLGGYGTTGTYLGYLDEIRITQGVVRYTADFTPPDSFFEEAAVVASFATVTPLPLATVTAQHIPPVFAAFSATLTPPLAVVDGIFAPPIFCAITALGPVPVAMVEGYHLPYAAAVTAVLPAPLATFSAYHDWSQVVSSRPDFFAIYRAYLSAAGEETIELPLSSWQASLNNGERNSYVAAVVPSVSTFGELIAARAAGMLSIKKGYRNALSGEEQLEELFLIAVTNIRSDEGSQNSSCTLEGLATLNWPPPKTIAVAGVTYRRVGSDGALTLRGNVDLRVRPGDTVTYNGDSFVVGRLSIQVAVSTESMEMTEA